MTISHGFELLRSQEVAELKTHAHLYRHVRTGADLLSLHNDDENKVFAVTFRTPPADSTGIAHIMEHAVLGGSHKYPLKEPFVQLVKGSLKTFLNAMTYPDKTVYPVASTNLQDFYNLIDVYIDAVFHPLLTPHHLDQEGWHYELEQVDGMLVYKGIVYNEMKGAYSSPDNLLHRASQQAIFPDNPYGFDSGGDPRAIPDLTYEAFRAFHATYYHPSNARFFFYGDDDMDERLRRLDAVLSGFEPAPVDGRVARQKPFAEPRRVVLPYGVDGAAEHARKTMMLVNWLLPENDDPNLTMGLSILSYALIATQASPLRKALIDSGLGEDVTGGGLDSGLRQMTFHAGLKGMARDAVDAAETLVMETLARLAEEGFDPEMVEAAVNSIEFSLRENNTGPYPRGLSLLFNALTTWLYDLDPLAHVAYEAPLAATKARLAADPGYLSGLIRAHLLDNPHRVTVVLEPDPTHNARLAAEEKARLAAARAAMSEAELEAIVHNTATLKQLQETPDPPELLAKLPSLRLSDLERMAKTIPLAVSDLCEVQVVTHDLFTNGIVYLDLGFDLRALPQDLLPYANFFGRALVEMGTETEDYVQLSQRIDRKTGGVWPSNFVSDIHRREETSAWFFLHGKATVAQAPALLDILRDVLLTVKLDNPARFRQIVLKSKARLEASLIPSGHSYVSARLRAALSPAGWVDEQMGGVSYLAFVRRLAEEVDRDWPGVLAKLEEVRRLLVNRRGMIVNGTLDAANWTQLEPRLAELLTSLPAVPGAAMDWTPAALPAHEGLAIPAQVNYVGKGARLYDLGYRHHGSINVITNFVRTGWLWDKIRAQGGAYGAFCSFGRQSGVFTFLSYRDPNLLGTLAAYDATARHLRNVSLSEDELTKSIIGAISALDAYQLPDAKGTTSLIRTLLGETDEERQRIRDEVLGTTAADFHAFAEVLEAVNREGRVVVMGAADALEAANSQGDGWLAIQSVMKRSCGRLHPSTASPRLGTAAVGSIRCANVHCPTKMER